jgi:hypothetical protein
MELNSLMMEAAKVSETLVFCSELTRLIVREDFIRHESLNSPEGQWGPLVLRGQGSEYFYHISTVPCTL